MTPDRRRNLQRLLQPASVAIIGGRDAITVIGECRRIGYTGHIWPVNPKREELAGLRCFKDVEELPEAPDAVFLAIPADRAVPVVAKLASMGAGGVVCYTAGFGEDGREGGEDDNADISIWDI